MLFSLPPTIVFYSLYATHRFLHLMGRTIPSFRIAAVLEEEKWKSFRICLRNKNEKKLFTHMFSISNLYNAASSNSIIPIRIYPILMSIVFNHFKTLKEKNCFDRDFPSPPADFKKDINNIDNNNNNNNNNKISCYRYSYDITLVIVTLSFDEMIFTNDMFQ